MRVGRAELCVGLTFEGLSFSCVRDSPLHVLNVREAASQVEWHYSNAIRAPRTSACRRSRSVAWSETDGADTHTISSTHEFHVTRPQVSFSNLLRIFLQNQTRDIFECEKSTKFLLIRAGNQFYFHTTVEVNTIDKIYN